MFLKLPRLITKYEKVEKELLVRDMTTVPTWIADGGTCCYCKFPLSEHNHPNTFSVVANLEEVGITWFHSSCFEVIEKTQKYKTT
jgi:nitrous oxide reductase accessory protein NosL